MRMTRRKRRRVSTSNTVFTVKELISYISHLKGETRERRSALSHKRDIEECNWKFSDDFYFLIDSMGVDLPCLCTSSYEEVVALKGGKIFQKKWSAREFVGRFLTYTRFDLENYTTIEYGSVWKFMTFFKAAALSILYRRIIKEPFAELGGWQIPGPNLDFCKKLIGLFRGYGKGNFVSGPPGIFKGHGYGYPFGAKAIANLIVDRFISSFKGVWLLRTVTSRKALDFEYAHSKFRRNLMCLCIGKLEIISTVSKRATCSSSSESRIPLMISNCKDTILRGMEEAMTRCLWSIPFSRLRVLYGELLPPTPGVKAKSDMIKVLTHKLFRGDDLSKRRDAEISAMSDVDFHSLRLCNGIPNEVSILIMSFLKHDRDSIIKFGLVSYDHMCLLLYTWQSVTVWRSTLSYIPLIVLSRVREMTVHLGTPRPRASRHSGITVCTDNSTPTQLRKIFQNTTPGRLCRLSFVNVTLRNLKSVFVYLNKKDNQRNLNIRLVMAGVRDLGLVDSTNPARSKKVPTQIPSLGIRELFPKLAKLRLNCHRSVIDEMLMNQIGDVRQLETLSCSGTVRVGDKNIDFIRSLKHLMCEELYPISAFMGQEGDSDLLAERPARLRTLYLRHLYAECFRSERHSRNLDRPDSDFSLEKSNLGYYFSLVWNVSTLTLETLFDTESFISHMGRNFRTWVFGFYMATFRNLRRLKIEAVREVHIEAFLNLSGLESLDIGVTSSGLGKSSRDIREATRRRDNLLKLMEMPIDVMVRFQEKRESHFDYPYDSNHQKVYITSASFHTHIERRTSNDAVRADTRSHYRYFVMSIKKPFFELYKYFVRDVRDVGDGNAMDERILQLESIRHIIRNTILDDGGWLPVLNGLVIESYNTDMDCLGLTAGNRRSLSSALLRDLRRHGFETMDASASGSRRGGIFTHSFCKSGPIND